MVKTVLTLFESFRMVMGTKMRMLYPKMNKDNFSNQYLAQNLGSLLSIKKSKFDLPSKMAQNDSLINKGRNHHK